MMVETLISEKELCEWMKISRSTVRKLRDNDLPFIEVGSLIRYSKEDVQEWLQKHRHLLSNGSNAAKEVNVNAEDKNGSHNDPSAVAKVVNTADQIGSSIATKG